MAQNWQPVGNQAFLPGVANPNASVEVGCCAVGTDVSKQEAGLVYAGPKRGAWIRTETYEYVGDNRGDYDAVEWNKTGPSKTIFFWCGGVSFFGVCALVVYFAFWWQTPSLSQYACNGSVELGPRRKAYCCRTYNLQCQPDIFFNCNTRDMPNQWSPDKRRFCCRTAGKGCNLLVDPVSVGPRRLAPRPLGESAEAEPAAALPSADWPAADGPAADGPAADGGA